MGLACQWAPICCYFLRGVVEISGWWLYSAWDIMVIGAPWDHNASTGALGMFFPFWVSVLSPAYAWLLPLRWSNVNEAMVCVRCYACAPEDPGSQLYAWTAVHPGPFSLLEALHWPTLCCLLLVSTWWWFVSLCKTDYNYYVSIPIKKANPLKGVSFSALYIQYSAHMGTPHTMLFRSWRGLDK